MIRNPLPPPPGASLNLGHPLARGMLGLGRMTSGGWVTYVNPSQPTLVGGSSVVDAGGPGRTHAATTDSTPVLLDNSLLPTTQATVAFYLTIKSTTFGDCFSFANDGALADGSSRLSGHFPWPADAAIHWDFGGFSEGSTRLSASQSYLVPNRPLFFVMTTGPRGMEIWLDGALIASNGATPTRAASTGTWGHVPAGYNSSTNEIYHLTAIWNRQMSQAEVLALSADPFQMFGRHGVSPAVLAGSAVAANDQPAQYDDALEPQIYSAQIANWSVVDIFTGQPVTAVVLTDIFQADALDSIWDTTSLAALVANDNEGGLYNLVPMVDDLGAGTTATLAATEAADTASISASVEVIASLAATEAPDVASFTGGNTATLAATEASDTAAIVASVAVSASLAASEAIDTAAISASVANPASLAATEAADVAAISASLSVTATLAATEAPDVAAITGGLSAALAATEAADTAAIVASVANPATLAATEARDTASITASVAIPVALAATEQADSAAVSASVAVSATMAASESADVVSIAAYLGQLRTYPLAGTDQTYPLTGTTQHYPLEDVA